MQQSQTLTKPVGSLMRPLPRVWASASVAAAATEIRDSGLPVVGVTEGFFYVAVVTQSSLGIALSTGIQPDDPIEKAYDKNAPTLPPYAPGERALEIFSEGNVSAIPIVDDYGHLMGVVTPADLFPKRDRAPRPHTVGGMATPFGVYLTTGSIGAGAKGWALVSTGVAMTLILCVVLTICGYAHDFLASHFARTFRSDHANALLEDATAVGIFLLFLIAFRLLPLAGIHAAEHKVVHAIERGEELTRENVRRMPRVHPRCGTNLVVGLSLLTGIGSLKSLPLDDGSRILLAAVATLFFWRPLGSLAQYWGTTKEPTDRQLDMGIRSGEELLEAYATGPGAKRSIWTRIWNTGILHVLAGSTATIGLLLLIQAVLHVSIVPISLAPG